MQLTRTAYGTWSGGRFMHFGEALDDAHYLRAIEQAYEQGIRTFMTADVYGGGEADQMLGKALSGVPRDSYCLVGAVGHDFYNGERAGSKGFPRFTDPNLRGPKDYENYLKMATEKSLERLGQDRFDCVLLHNPDSIGYTHESVWSGMEALRSASLTELLGIAPGPANGFTLDLIGCIERFSDHIDWAMIILNPLEPWPGSLALPAADKHGVDIITRVVDYGGLFHDDVKPGHQFATWDHRTYRPEGWVEAGAMKLEQMRDIANSHGITMLQLACIWNLMQPAVKSVIPTIIQELGQGSKPIGVKISELAALPEDVKLTQDECQAIEEIGNNRNCMALKGGSPVFEGEPTADQWPLTDDLREVGARWSIEPEKDLVKSH